MIVHKMNAGLRLYHLQNVIYELSVRFRSTHEWRGFPLTLLKVLLEIKSKLRSLKLLNWVGSAYSAKVCFLSQERFAVWALLPYFDIVDFEGFSVKFFKNLVIE